MKPSEQIEKRARELADENKAAIWEPSKELLLSIGGTEENFWKGSGKQLYEQLVINCRTVATMEFLDAWVEEQNDKVY
jgi:hypothetical protein